MDKRLANFGVVLENRKPNRNNQGMMDDVEPFAG